VNGYAQDLQQLLMQPLPAMPWQGITTPWQSSQSKSTYEDNVRLIKEKIADGDIYQVNLCRILSTDCDQSLQGLAVNLQSKNPAPFASYLKLDGLEICIGFT